MLTVAANVKPKRRHCGTKNLKAITQLNLTVNASKISLDHIAFYLPSLRRLTLDGSIISSARDLGLLGGFVPSLCTVSLSDVGLRDLGGICGALPYISELRASRNSIVDVTPLATHEHIRLLDLSHNLISADVFALELLGTCPHLEELDLRDNAISAYTKEGAVVNYTSDYRQTAAHHIPQLAILDGRHIHRGSVNPVTDSTASLGFDSCCTGIWAKKAAHQDVRHKILCSSVETGGMSDLSKGSHTFAGSVARSLRRRRTAWEDIPDTKQRDNKKCNQGLKRSPSNDRKVPQEGYIKKNVPVCRENDESINNSAEGSLRNQVLFFQRSTTSGCSKAQGAISHSDLGAKVQLRGMSPECQNVMLDKWLVAPAHTIGEEKKQPPRLNLASQKRSRFFARKGARGVNLSSSSDDEGRSSDDDNFCYDINGELQRMRMEAKSKNRVSACSHVDVEKHDRPYLNDMSIQGNLKGSQRKDISKKDGKITSNNKDCASSKAPHYSIYALPSCDDSSDYDSGESNG